MAPRRPNDGHIKRPRNAFLCFRCDKSAVREAVRRFPDAFTQAEALGMLWRTFNEEEKKPWTGMALEEAKQHAETYPGFRNTTRKKSRNFKAQRMRKVALRKSSGSGDDLLDICNPGMGRGNSVQGIKEMQRQSGPSRQRELPFVTLERQTSVIPTHHVVSYSVKGYGDEPESTARYLSPESRVKGTSAKSKETLLFAMSNNAIRATPDTPNDSLPRTMLPSKPALLDTGDEVVTIQVSETQIIDKTMMVPIIIQGHEIQCLQSQSAISATDVPISTESQGKSSQYCTILDIPSQSWNEDKSAADFDYDEWLQFPDDGDDDA